MTIATVILAAGAGTRVGGPKAFLTWEGETFLARIVRRATTRECSPIITVLATDVRHPPPEAAGTTCVQNTKPELGQLSSLKLGIEALKANLDVTAALSWPVDHPFVEPPTLAMIAVEHKRSPEHIIIPTFENRGGHPTLFPRSLFDELLALPLDRGARSVIEKHAARVRRLPVADRWVCYDIDTPEDFEELRTLRPGL